MVGACAGDARAIPRRPDGATARPTTSRGVPRGPAAGRRRAACTSTRRSPAGSHELQPGTPGQSHLGPEPEQAPGLDLVDPPEVDGVAAAQPGRVPASAPQTDAADQAVDPTPARQASDQEYQPCRTADPLDDPPERRRCAATSATRWSTYSDRRPSPGRWAGGRTARRATRAGPAGMTSPPRMRASASRTASSKVTSPSGGSGPTRDVVLVADDLVTQRLDEGTGDGARHRRDQPDPVARQRR